MRFETAQSRNDNSKPKDATMPSTHSFSANVRSSKAFVRPHVPCRDRRIFRSTAQCRCGVFRTNGCYRSGFSILLATVICRCSFTRYRSRVLKTISYYRIGVILMATEIIIRPYLAMGGEILGSAIFVCLAYGHGERDAEKDS